MFVVEETEEQTGRVFLAYGTLLASVDFCSGSLDKRCHPLIFNGRKCNRTSGGLGEMGISGEYLEKGGMVYEKGGEVLCGGGESSAPVWV